MVDRCLGVTLLGACSFSTSLTTGDAASDSVAMTATVTVTFQDDGAYDQTHDTMLDAQSATAANGSGSELSWDSDDGHWGLLRFGSIVGPNVDQIPPSAEVASAILRITAIDSSDSGNPGRIRRVLVPWNQDTTHAQFSQDGQIGAPEMDISTSIAAPTSEGPHQIDVTAVVRGWVSNPDKNYGWIVEPASSNGLSIHSSEAAVGTRPALVVTYMR